MCLMQKGWPVLSSLKRIYDIFYICCKAIVQIWCYISRNSSVKLSSYVMSYKKDISVNLQLDSKDQLTNDMCAFTS